MTRSAPRSRSLRGATLGLVALLAAPAFAQDWDKVPTRGNGVLMQTHVPLPAYDSVRVRGPIDVQIGEGPSDGAEVHVDSNLAGRVRLDVEGSELVITMVGNSQNLHKKSRILLRTPSLTAVRMESSADVKVLPRRQKAPKLDLAVHGSGDLDWKDGDAETLSLEIAGSGDVDLKGTFRTAKLTSTGSGDLEVDLQIRDRLEVTSQGSGDVELRGSVQALAVKMHGSGDLEVKGNCIEAIEATVSGSGDLDAEKFRCREARVTTQGSGGAKVAVVEKGALSLDAQGSGKIDWWDGAQKGTVGGQARTFHRGR